MKSLRGSLCRSITSKRSLWAFFYMRDKEVKNFDNAFVIGAMDGLFAASAREKQHKLIPLLQFLKFPSQFVDSPAPLNLPSEGVSVWTHHREISLNKPCKELPI